MTETTTLRAFTPSANVSFLKESATIAVSARARALKARGARSSTSAPASRTSTRRSSSAARGSARSMRARRSTLRPRGSCRCARSSPRRRARGGAATRSRRPKWSCRTARSSRCSTPASRCSVRATKSRSPRRAGRATTRMVALSKATPVPVIGDPDNGLKVTAAYLDAAATPRTTGVMLNSPCNPTGAVYTESELREILELADERDWWVLSDRDLSPHLLQRRGAVRDGSVDAARSPGRDQWRGEGVRDDRLAHRMDDRAACRERGDGCVPVAHDVERRGGVAARGARGAHERR